MQTAQAKRLPLAQHRLIRDIVLCGESRHTTRYETYLALKKRGFLDPHPRWTATANAKAYVDRCEREDNAR